MKEPAHDVQHYLDWFPSWACTRPERKTVCVCVCLKTFSELMSEKVQTWRATIIWRGKGFQVSGRTWSDQQRAAEINLNQQQHPVSCFYFFRSSLGFLPLKHNETLEITSIWTDLTRRVCPGKPEQAEPLIRIFHIICALTGYYKTSVAFRPESLFFNNNFIISFSFCFHEPLRGISQHSREEITSWI